MIRTLIPVALAAALTFSLIYSSVIRHGHADVPIAESADQVQPLGVGDPAPRFVVAAVDSSPVEFDPQSLDNPVMLLVFRGGWCPYCNVYLSEMRHVIPEIQSLGIEVLFLSGDRPALLYDSLEGQAQEDIAGLDYTILSDADAQASIALGIAFKASRRTIDYVQKKGDGYVKSSMERHGVLPVPAVFAIGRDGVIAFAHVNPDYKVRLPAEELLAAAKAIAAAD